MTTMLLVLVPALVLPVVLLFSFAGCVGEDPDVAREEGKQEGIAQGRAEGEQIATDTAAADAAAVAEAKKYENILRSVPTEDLRGYWRLDDSGGTAADVHTNVIADRHDGVYVDPAAVDRTVPGALSFGQQPADRAAEFNGSTGYVEVEYRLLLNPQSDFTVEVWIRPDSTIETRQVVIGSYKETAGALDSGYSLEVVMVPTPTVFARLGNPGAETTLEAGLGDGLERDGWRHVVMTYTHKEKCLRLYVDADNATPDAFVGSATAPVFYVANETERLRFGAGPGPGDTPVRPFHGRIDEVAVYGMPLAGARVQAHFKAAISSL